MTGDRPGREAAGYPGEGWGDATKAGRGDGFHSS